MVPEDSMPGFLSLEDVLLGVSSQHGKVERTNTVSSHGRRNIREKKRSMFYSHMVEVMEVPGSSLKTVP